jgi:bifunctional non-homologous end joining protein LigD
MRDFSRTREPPGVAKASRRAALSFVVQKHAARRLHYDFRLEWNGTLLSWAVPNGPSLDPADKRLAVQVEDHPIDYRDFEGTIPKGEYGGGEVIVWDRGTWTPLVDPDEGLRKGHLEVELDGEKLHGRFHLVRTRRDSKKPSWLLFKGKDEHAEAHSKKSLIEARPESVLTGRTIEDIRTGVPKRSPKTTKKNKTRDAKRGKHGRVTRLPPFASIAPELATLVKDVPVPEAPFIYELKFDGYRTLTWLEDGKVRMASRSGLDWTDKYGPIAREVARLRAKSAIFDGEVAYVDEAGRTNFERLQGALGSTSAEAKSRLVYFIFDLLYYDGVDLREQPLSARRAALRTILAGIELPLKLSDDVTDGRTFFREVCKLDLEGIIGKRHDRPYRSGRSTDWIKLKCQKRQEMVIVGFTPPKGSRKGIGALVIALHEGKTGKLRFAGKVGTGFSHATLADLERRLGAIVVDKPPVPWPSPPPVRSVTWVEPELVCQVRFTEWTSDGVLRHPSFEGLRFDKDAREVTKETEAALPKAATAPPNVHGIKVSHPERVLDPESGLTKLDLVRYMGEAAARMMPFLANRPLMLLRCPAGIGPGLKKGQAAFHQKHSGRGLDHVGLGTEVLGGEEVIYATSDEQLVDLAQNNTIELHGWGCRLPAWEKPDWIVIDLDPAEDLPFSRVVESAFATRDALKTLRLESWVKTTGGKGLHVVVPIARLYDWETIRRASETIAVLMARAAPSEYVATMSKRARAGKIFIDYLRNASGATAVLPYSPRARPGLPVALPVSWKDLRAIDPGEHTIVTVPKLLARRHTDPWAALLESKQTLPHELVSAARS